MSITSMFAQELALANFRSSQYPGLPSSRIRVDLGGAWERYVNGLLYDVITVPSSQRLMGYYRLQRNYVLPPLMGAQRAFLHFNTVNYFSRVSVNETALGVTGPYVPYEFEMTTVAREGNNTVAVSIADLRPETDGAGKYEIEFGLSYGWEAYSGIVRDVYVEFRPAAFIENVRFGYTLSPNYTKASCRVELFLNSAVASAGHVEVSLLRGATVIARAEKDVSVAATASEIALAFDVDEPLLWSPETPDLYTLAARLRAAGAEDIYRCRTGFRDVRVQGSNFELNGSRLVLHGVCRHDLWKDQGFTLTLDQMQQDMQMIKSLGANYIRLVHYPHHRRIVELADELGLLVTEEPGFFINQGNFSPGIIDVGLEVMERAIRRDWNSPSVFAWLLSNECNNPPDFLREGKALCKRLDPIGRLVSVSRANAASKEENVANNRAIYDAAGLDYYSYHNENWNEDGENFEEVADGFGPGKPLVFDEWGWESISYTEFFYQRKVDRLMDVIEEGKLAGHSFWSWEDYRMYSSPLVWIQHNGVTTTGVVDESRVPRERLYMELNRLFQMRRNSVTASNSPPPEPVPLRVPPWAPQTRLQPIELQTLGAGEVAHKAWADLETRMARYWSAARIPEDHWISSDGKWITEDLRKRTSPRPQFWQLPEVEIAGATFRCPVADGLVRPLVLTPDFPTMVIPIGLQCRRLHMLGHVTLPTGFPLQGKAGETAAEYTLLYASGATQRIPLRHGFEIAQANLIHEATRVNPIATAAQRALVFSKDPARERYQLLLFSLPLGGGAVDRLHITLHPDAPPLLLFAINAELA